MTWASSLLVSALVVLVWTILIRTIPSIVSKGIEQRIEHRNNKNLEEIKATLQASYSTVGTSVDFLSAVQPELRSKMIASVEACLSGCHIHPLDIGCVSSMHRDSWTFSTAPTCNSLSPFPSFSGFFQMTRPVPPTWIGLAGAMGSPARTAASWANLTASPRGRAC